MGRTAARPDWHQAVSAQGPQWLKKRLLGIALTSGGCHGNSGERSQYSYRAACAIKRYRRKRIKSIFIKCKVFVPDYLGGGTNSLGSAEPWPNRNCSICSTRNCCASGFQGWRRYSFSSILECSLHIRQASALMVS